MTMIIGGLKIKRETEASIKKPDMVDKATMIDEDLASDSDSLAQRLPVQQQQVLQSTADNELIEMNKALLDEVRLVTSELADSVRRELIGGDDMSQSDQTIERAQRIVELEQTLDLERRKRLYAESHLRNDSNFMQEIAGRYSIVELEQQLTEKDRIVQSQQLEHSLIQENYNKLNSEFEDLQVETNQLKNGILPELKSHVEDLEMLTLAGNPIELMKQIEELKVANKQMENLVEENSTRGPLGEKIKSVESQRDALREALRSLRERKDHEIRQGTDRVRQLESKLEKERLAFLQIQRKYVQQTASLKSSLYYNNTENLSNTNLNAFLGVTTIPKQPPHSNTSSTSSYSSGTTASFSSEPANGLGALNMNGATNGNIQPISKRRGVGGVPGIVPPDAIIISSRPSSPSPVSFEISQEPTWLDYVDTSRLHHHGSGIIDKVHSPSLSSNSPPLKADHINIYN